MARCTRHGTAASATAAGLRGGFQNGKLRGTQLEHPDLNVPVSITDRAPFVPVGRGVQHLTQRATGSPERRNARRLDRRNRGWNDTADGRRANRRQINRTIAQRLDLTVNATTDTGCVGVRHENNGESETAEKSHAVASPGSPGALAISTATQSRSSFPRRHRAHGLSPAHRPAPQRVPSGVRRTTGFLPAPPHRRHPCAAALP
jgi:hypothetical protein